MDLDAYYDELHGLRLADWSPDLHPRGWAGRFVDAPDLVDVDAFKAGYQQALDGERGMYLTDYSDDELAEMKLFTAYGGKVGGALKQRDDGLLEAVSLFNIGGPPGSGKEMLRFLKDQGASRLDCFGEVLRSIYESVGFKVLERLEWDDQYAPSRWRPDIDPRLPVYYMGL